MGVGWKEKVGAVHAGFRIGWAKGVVERKGETGFGSGDERGGHAAAPCVLGVNSQIPAMLESGVWQRLKKPTKPCRVAVVRHISIFHSVGLRNIVGSLLSSGRRIAFPQWVVLAGTYLRKGAEEMTLHVCAVLQCFSSTLSCLNSTTTQAKGYPISNQSSWISKLGFESVSVVVF